MVLYSYQNHFLAQHIQQVCPCYVDRWEMQIENNSCPTIHKHFVLPLQHNLPSLHQLLGTQKPNQKRSDQEQNVPKPICPRGSSLLIQSTMYQYPKLSALKWLYFSVIQPDRQFVVQQDI